MEENESFQLLLGQATLSGEFSKENILKQYPDSPKEDVPPIGSNLAEELEATAQKVQQQKKFEAEIKYLKDQNKALSLYISNIIERLLDNKLEGILDKSMGAEKELPPIPDTAPEAAPTLQPLSRTRSVTGRRMPIRTSMPPPVLPATTSEGEREDEEP